jgi:hypothetical protein
VIAFFGFLLFLVGIFVAVTTIVGMVRIVTNCGYSGWWVLGYFSPPIIGYLLGIGLVATVSATGASASHFLGVAFGYFIIMIVSFLVSQLIFIKFAFADWPLMQQARARQASSAGFSPFGYGRGGFGGAPLQADPSAAPPPLRAAAASTAAPPAWGPLPGQAPATSAPPPPAQEGTDPGWYRSGPIGAGEQSYWDGITWIARRRWQNNAWVDLPPPLSPPPAADPRQGTDTPS